MDNKSQLNFIFFDRKVVRVLSRKGAKAQRKEFIRETRGSNRLFFYHEVTKHTKNRLSCWYLAGGSSIQLLRYEKTLLRSKLLSRPLLTAIELRSTRPETAKGLILSIYEGKEGQEEKTFDRITGCLIIGFNNNYNNGI